MLKGVNRMVLEIPRPESAYFESVLFFVKPEHAGTPPDTLRKKAASLLRDVAPAPAGRVPGANRLLKIGSYLLAALLGALAAGIAGGLF